MTTKAQHPCDGMTKRQREVFEQIAIDNAVGHHPHVLAALVAAELIHRYEHVENLPEMPGATLTTYRYSVPLDVHMQWCAWCSENVSDEMLEGWA